MSSRTPDFRATYAKCINVSTEKPDSFTPAGLKDLLYVAR